MYVVAYRKRLVLFFITLHFNHYDICYVLNIFLPRLLVLFYYKKLAHPVISASFLNHLHKNSSILERQSTIVLWYRIGRRLFQKQSIKFKIVNIYYEPFSIEVEVLQCRSYHISNRKRMTDVPHQKRTKCPFKYLLALTLINYHRWLYSIYGQSKKRFAGKQ